MKKHYTFLFTFTFMLAAVLGYQSVNAQTTVYYQNFDSTTNLPTGWNSTTTSGGSPWVLDPSGSDSSYTWNLTDGYDGASGHYNVEIANPTTGTIGAYAYTSVLYTCNIPTTNWASIKVGWGSRNTKHFEDGGSEIQGLYMSTDGGSTWDSVPYIGSTSTSAWYWENNPAAAELPVAGNITLPGSAAHQANLMFKWIADIYYTASGNYRLDDFIVNGVSSPNAVNDVQEKPSALVYVIGNSTINIVAKDLQGTMNVELVDMVGHILKTQATNSETMSIDASGLASGIYLVRVSNGTSTEVTKVSINR